MVKERKNAVTRFAGVARALHRTRPVLYAIGAGALGWFLYAVSRPSGSSESALVPLILMIWAAFALGVGFTFSHVPPSIGETDPWLVRLRKRLVRAGYGFAVVAMLILAGTGSVLTVQAARLVLSS